MPAPAVSALSAPPVVSVRGSVRHSPKQHAGRHRGRFLHVTGTAASSTTYQSYAATGTVNYKLDAVNLTSVSNYQTNNNSWACDCNFQSTSNGTWATENSTWTAISRNSALSTFDFPLNFMAGVLAQKTTRVFDQWISFASLSDSAAPPQDQYIATSSIRPPTARRMQHSVQAIWKVIPEVEATAGLRYRTRPKDSLFLQPSTIPP